MGHHIVPCTWDMVRSNYLLMAQTFVNLEQARWTSVNGTVSHGIFLGELTLTHTLWRFNSSLLKLDHLQLIYHDLPNENGDFP